MIFVLGNICRDTSFYVDRLPLAGETVNATATRVGLGGKGLNQAVAASSAGADVTLVAGIGEDWGEADESAVKATGCGDLTLALIRKSGPLDCSSIIVSEAGENLIVTNAAQAEALSIEDAAPHLTFAPSDVLLIQCNLQPDVTAFAAREARRAGARVIFNPAPLEALGLVTRKPCRCRHPQRTGSLRLDRQDRCRRSSSRIECAARHHHPRRCGLRRQAARRGGAPLSCARGEGHRRHGRR